MRAYSVLLGSVLLLGCGEASTAGWVEADAEALLADGATDWIPERAGLIDYGRARLTAAGGALTPPEERAQSQEHDRVAPIQHGMTVVDDRDGLRVLWQDRQVRMLLWLDEADFETVVYTPDWAAAVPDGLAEPGIGARLTAGLPVEVLASEGDRTQIYRRGVQLEVAAWLPAPQVRSYFREVEDDFEAPLAHGSQGLLPVGTPLLDMPYGAPFATVTEPADTRVSRWWHHGGLEVERVGEPADGHQRVQVEEIGMFVRGWVPVESIEPMPFGGRGASYGSSFGCGGCWGHGGEPTLKAGALLTAEPDGEIVAIPLHSLYRAPARLDEATGAVAFAVNTPWGDAEVWADSWDVTPRGWAAAEALGEGTVGH